MIALRLPHTCSDRNRRRTFRRLRSHQNRRAMRTLKQTLQTGTVHSMNTLITKLMSLSRHRYTTHFCACAASPNHQNWQKNIFQRILLRFGCDLTRRFRSHLKRCAQSGRKACIRFPSDISVLFWHVGSGLIWTSVRQPLYFKTIIFWTSKSRVNLNGIPT